MPQQGAAKCVQGVPNFAQTQRKNHEARAHASPLDRTANQTQDGAQVRRAVMGHGGVQPRDRGLQLHGYQTSQGFRGGFFYTWNMARPRRPAINDAGR